MEEPKKYFEVHKEELVGTIVSGEIYSDGDYINLPDDMEQRSIITGYSVYEYDEQGVRQNTEFYPVATDMGTFEDNEDEVLSKIIKEHDPSEWQNNNW